MKKSVKYICVLLMLVGVNVSAWGVTITLKAWNKSTSSYVDIGTIEKGNKPGDGVGTYSGGYLSVIAWAPGIQKTDTHYPTNGGGSNGSTYYNQYGYPKQDYNGDATTLYAVYSYGGYYTTEPDVQFTELLDCTPLSVPTGLDVNTKYVFGENTYVRFSWTPGSGTSTNAENQEICFGLDGEAGKCVSTLKKNDTSAGALRSKFSNGKYWWKVRALGNGETYCDSEYEEGDAFCIDDVESSTPSGVTASSIGTTSATVSWSSMSDAEGYAVTIKNNSTGVKVNGYDEEMVDGTSLSVTGLNEGTTYKVEIYAYNACMDVSLTNNSYTFTTLTEYSIDLLAANSSGTEDGLAGVYTNATALLEITEPTKTGYTIEGYYADAARTQKIADESGNLVASVTVSSTPWTNSSSQWVKGGDATFYTNWTPIPYTVSFNNNGGSGSMGDVEKDYGSSYDLPECSFAAPAGKVFDHWAEGSAGGTSRAVGYTHTVTANITFYAVWRDATFTDYVFSCAELTLTPKLVTDGTPIFITSAASKTVRSQDSILIVGSGLTPSTALTFPDLPAKFEIKSRTYTSLSTDASGAIDAVAYIFYTPASGDTEDGLDEIAGITVSVEGAKPKTVNLTQDIIGRHLPSEFVIAGKYNGMWYALPSTMANTTNPNPVLIAADDDDTPTTAYTSTDNAYSLYDQTSSVRSGGNGQYVKLAMKGYEDKALFGQAAPSTEIGQSKGGTPANDLSAGYWWQLKQINTSITNAEDAKYNIYSANNTSSLSIKNNPNQWGLYASGVEELRLLKLEETTPISIEVTEWGKNSVIFDVNPKTGDNLANKVVAYLGNVTSGAKDVMETTTSVKAASSKYNYTVHFGSEIDFSAAASEGALLRLEWKKGETTIGTSVILVPKIIAGNAILHDLDGYKTHWENKEVHVLPGNTLTVDAGNFENNSVTIGSLEIYPGATVVVTKGNAANGTLNVTDLVLRYGWTRANSKAYDVARLYVTPGTANLMATRAYADWYIDFDQYYPVAVPWTVTTSGMSYKNSNSAASAGVKMRYYDGAQRATTGQAMIGQNWKEYNGGSSPAYPATLDPSTGYAMTARRPTGKAFSIVRMPLTIPSAEWTAFGEQGSVSGTHKDQVSVTGWGMGTAEWYAMGWNFVGNPYMATFNGDDDGISGKLQLQNGGSVRYATIPDLEFLNYDQVPIEEANLKPASGFFIQANSADAQTITFAAGNIVAPAAPARFANSQETMPEQEAYIRLSDEETLKDQMGLIIGEEYTEAYEPNADLVKVLGDADALKTYMHYTGMDMAYVAVNEMLAKEWIPVTVQIPNEGDYTFSLTNSSVVERLEGVYLIDYQHDIVTNLIGDTYSFHIEKGVHTNRFAINAVAGKRDTPTGIDAVDGKTDTTKPVKFLYRDNVYILHNGVIYDATGKKVSEINK